MSVNDLSAALAVDEESITGSMYEVLDALADTMPMMQAAHAPATSKYLDGVIDIHCSTPAQLAIRADQAIGFKLAEAWGLTGENGPSEADAVDAMGELTNVVGGSMKFLFSGESRLGLPQVEIIDAAHEEDSRSWVEVSHSLGRFKVELRPIES